MTENTSPESSPEETRPFAVYVARRAVLYSYGSLLGLFTMDAVVKLAAGAPVAVALVLWLVASAPLLLFLPGLRSQSPRAAAWLSFAILLYFIHAVTVAFVPGQALYGSVYALLCAALFSALVYWIRVMRKHYHITLQ